MPGKTHFQMTDPDEDQYFDDDLYTCDDEPDPDDSPHDPDEWKYELADLWYDSRCDRF